MDKTKMQLAVALAVVSLICIVLAVNAAASKSQLNAEREKIASLSSQVVKLEAEINGQAGALRDTQNTLNASRREAEALRVERNSLQAERNELQVKIDEALESLAAATTLPVTVEAPSETSVSVAE